MMDDPERPPPGISEGSPDQLAHNLRSQTGQPGTEAESDVQWVPRVVHRSRHMGNAARAPSRFATSTWPRPAPRAEAKRELERRCRTGHLDCGDISTTD